MSFDALYSYNIARRELWQVMKREDFLARVNTAIDPESGLRVLTQDDLKLLEEFNILRPPYYADHVHKAMGWLRNKIIRVSQH